MNLRDLHYLVAVADLRSFVQAAEQCCISQPTLSTQIKKMEDSLGVQIFERTNKKVLLTELGEPIIAAAKRILLEEKTINELANNAKDPLSGNFRLGAFPTLAPYYFPALVPLINSALPKVRLILVEEKTDILLGLLKQGQLDAALLALPIEDEVLQTHVLFEDEFLLAVATHHPYAKLKQVTLKDLAQQQVLLLDEGHCLRGQALQVCQLSHAEEPQDVRATSLETLRQMVIAGTGITFMPKIARHKTEKGIRYLDFKPVAPKRTIAIAWRKTSSRNQLIQAVIELLSGIDLS